MTDTENINRLPDGRAPFGEGRIFIVIVPEDVTTEYGNVSVPAGTYETQASKRDDWTAEGDITVWTDHHYTGRGIYVGLNAHHWHFPGEAPRPLPEHDCMDHLRSGTVDGIFCGICMQEVF